MGALSPATLPTLAPLYDIAKTYNAFFLSFSSNHNYFYFKSLLPSYFLWMGKSGNKTRCKISFGCVDRWRIPSNGVNKLSLSMDLQPSSLCPETRSAQSDNRQGRRHPSTASIVKALGCEPCIAESLSWSSLRSLKPCALCSSNVLTAFSVIRSNLAESDRPFHLNLD